MNIIDAIINASIVKNGTILSLGDAFQGVWTAGVTYQKGQIVSANGNLFVCLDTHADHPPPDTGFWDDITMRGPTGATGPPGNPGSPGGSGNQIVVRAGQVLGSHRAVLLDSTGHAVYADSSDVRHAGRLCGITAHAAVVDEFVTVHLVGEMIDSSWVWDLSRPVFLGTNGQLTQVPPNTGFMQVIGQPITAQSLFLHPKPSITLA
ncbi:MAG: hypothetical protein HQL90_15220 [Magnetococcales bacterium]|nr:hypothetical protein [Magnetococcales bacterium]